ncbi:MAG: glycogen synthase GlgA [Shimia sp.]
MKVLSVTSECVPLVKTGGLADVAGALPAALAGQGVEMRTLLPGYPAVMAAVGKGKIVAKFPDLFGGSARLREGALGDSVLYALDAPHLYDREGAIYAGPGGADWPDNPERFAALSWVAAEIAQGAVKGWSPDALHCHDWQAGLAPVYLRQAGSDVPSLLTIHNIAFQGLAPATRLADLRLDQAGMNVEGFEYWGQISALKAGLTHATKISTVSPTYAAELMRAEYGFGLDGVLRWRRGDLSGILNGIDLEAWAPPYRNAKGKAKAKAALRERLGLPEADGPLCIIVSRLTEQKGIDLVLDALPHLLGLGGQLAVLGSGDRRFEDALRRAADDPNVSVTIGYDEALSRELMAGGDAILVPSRFEPCGLTQLYGLRFATIPLVTTTGGLADTVIDASPLAMRAGVATGVQVHPVDAEALRVALSRLDALYRNETAWAQLQKNAFNADVGWGASAASYAALYREMTGR